MIPAGYVLMQHDIQLDRPVKAYGRWMARIPSVYRESVMGESAADVPPMKQDPYCLSTLKHYRSLMPMAMEARKPIFELKAADGAIGAHASSVQNCFTDFRQLARSIAEHCGIVLP